MFHDLKPHWTSFITSSHPLWQINGTPWCARFILLLINSQYRHGHEGICINVYSHNSFDFSQFIFSFCFCFFVCQCQLEQCIGCHLCVKSLLLGCRKEKIGEGTTKVSDVVDQRHCSWHWCSEHQVLWKPLVYISPTNQRLLPKFSAVNLVFLLQTKWCII